MTDLNAVLAAADREFENSLDRLFGFLRIPSISADPAYKEDCDKAANWIAGELNSLGFEAGVRPTPGRPMVVAHYRPKSAAAKTPHLLFYGHYDVQPVDPLEL